MQYADLLYFLFRVNAYKKGVSINQTYSIFESEDMSAFLNPTFKFVFFASVHQRRQELPLNTICVRTAQLSKNEGYNNFDYISRDDTEPKWTAEYLRSAIPKETKVIYVSAAPAIEADLLTALTAAGFSMAMIKIVP